MEPKKKLIGRLAVAAGVVLALSLAVLAGATLVGRATREDRLVRAKREREALVERSRKYVGELAHRVDGVPVDPALVGEIEARYFEEYASGPMQVWAMGTDGRLPVRRPARGVRQAERDLRPERRAEPQAGRVRRPPDVPAHAGGRERADRAAQLRDRPSEDDGAAWERWRRCGTTRSAPSWSQRRCAAARERRSAACT